MGDIINEGSSAYLTVAFTDENGDAVVPVSISYRIDCLSNRAEIRGNTSVTPASSIEIKLTPDDTAIVDSKNSEERRLLTLTAVLGDDDAIVDEYRYSVKNLGKV